MSVFDCAVAKEAWTHEIAMRNGMSGKTAQPADQRDSGRWEPAVREIISYLDLGENWDGYGAEPPSREVLESAIGLAYCYHDDGVDPPHRVAPGVAGSVIFEWQDPNGTYTTVEIDAPLHAEVMMIEPGKPAQQWTLPTQ